MEKKGCLECGEVIKGRSDKKFCSDLCRNSYNNKLNSDTNNTVRNINNILRKNRRILEENLSEEEKKVVSKQKLMDKGFNLKYFTNVQSTKENNSYVYCYEYGYLLLDNDKVLIVKKREKFNEKAN